MLIDVAKYIGAGIWEGVKNAGSIIKDRGVERDRRFQSKYGITREFAEDKAQLLGISSKQFAKTYAEARDAFYKSGGTVDFSQMSGMAHHGKSAQDLIFEAISSRSEFANQFAKKELDIPKFAEGGIVTGPTLAWVGEAGPEAIVPLQTASGASRASVSALDSYNGRSSAGTMVQISVTVDGQTTGAAIGQEIARSIERELMSFFGRRAQEA